MEWRSEGILLSRRPHGETGAVIDVLTAERGRWAGLVRGGGASRRAADLQPGAQLDLVWRGRLESQLGAFRAEPLRARAGTLLDAPAALAALQSVCALIARFVPEREAQPDIYAGAAAILDAIADECAARAAAGVRPDDWPHWPAYYAQWELQFLEQLGFGLDLSRCAATGGTQELVWVSPRSGRAVSRAAGAPYAAKLLPLPGFLSLGGPASRADAAAALRLTGWFLEHWAAPALETAPTPDAPATPPARTRLMRALSPAQQGPCDAAAASALF